MKESGNVWYICEFCFRAFLRVEDLDRHLEKDHGNLEQGSADLHPIASRAKTNYSRVIARAPVTARSKTPQSASSPVQQKRHACTYCQKSFSKRDFLTEHVRVHTGEKPYDCPRCESSFSIRANLRRHIRSLHTNEKPFKCKKCKKCFANKAHLKIHTRVHTGEKPHACGFCANSFITTTALARHVLIHTDEKPFSCNYCKSIFRTDKDLATHAVTHTHEKSFPCGTCKKAFTTNSAMRRHERTHTTTPKSRRNIQQDLKNCRGLEFQKVLQFARECAVRIDKSV